MTRGDTPVTVRLRLPYPDAPAFVGAFARHVKGGRLYLPTRQELPEGTVVRFELLDQGGRRLLLGEGPVVATRGPGGRVGVMVRVQRLAGPSKGLWAELTRSPVPAPADEATETATEEDEAPTQTSTVSLPAAPEAAGALDAVLADARIPAPEAEPPDAGTPEPLREFPWEEPEGAATDAAAAAEGPEDTQVGVFAQPTDLPVTAPALGIDLGTSHTLAAVAEKGRARMVRLGDPGGGLASVVAPGEWGGLEVGASALRRRLEQPEKTIFGAKRLLGRRFHAASTQALKAALPYALIPDDGGGVAVPLDDGPLTITEVHARILEVVRTVITEEAGAAPRRVVISVPAHFGDAQRAAVREAGLLAGLEVSRIVSEPTAAALAYGYGRGLAAKRLLVYDLGGGTFDVSVLTVSGDRFEVVATGGDDLLGGVDFDLVVVRRLLEALVAEGGPAEPDPRLLERLLMAAEEAKIALSEKDSHALRLVALWEDDAGEHDLALTLTRGDLEALTAELVERTMAMTLEVLARRGLTPDLVDEVLLVGGQSRMPKVRARVAEVFGRPPRDDVDPVEAVALGCALLAGSLGGGDDPEAPAVQLRDVLSVDIGVGLPDGRLLPVIEAMTPIPCERTLRVATSADDQTSLEIVVFQGPGPTLEEAEFLGSLAFVALPPGQAGEVSLQVRFALDAEGLLEVEAVHETTGESVARVLSTADTPEALRARLAEGRTLIHDPTQPGALAAGDRGFLSGLRRRLFRGER